MFLIPAVASVVLLAFLWWGGSLRRPHVVLGLVVAGVAGQFLAPAFSLVWVAALLLNVGVGVYLAIQLKLSW